MLVRFCVAYKHIFHPTDCSEDDRSALVHALRIAIAGRGEVTLFNVQDEEEDHAHFPHVTPLLEAWKLDATRDLRVKKVRQCEGPTVESAVHYINRHIVDIVVLATHQRHGLARFTGVEVALPIARQSRSVTLFVPPQCGGFVDPATGDVRIQSVLIPVDHHPAPGRAAERLVALLQQLGATCGVMHFLHVGEHSIHVNTPTLAGWQTSFERAEGSVVDSILAAAHDTQASLIVTPTEGRNGFLDSLRGSTSEQILRGADCPVLAVPANFDVP
jgi:nucleotide-binding universal stress UspA family protein